MEAWSLQLSNNSEGPLLGRGSWHERKLTWSNRFSAGSPARADVQEVIVEVSDVPETDIQQLSRWTSCRREVSAIIVVFRHTFLGEFLPLLYL